MAGRFYTPEEKICLIFDNVNYSRLRALPEFAKRHWDEPYMGSLRNELHYPDMPRATVWADEFEEGIKAFEFSPDQI